MEKKQVCGRNLEFSVKPEMFLEHLSYDAKYTDRYKAGFCHIPVQLMHYTQSPSGLSTQVALSINPTQRLRVCQMQVL